MLRSHHLFKLISSPCVLGRAICAVKMKIVSRQHVQMENTAFDSVVVQLHHNTVILLLPCSSGASPSQLSCPSRLTRYAPPMRGIRVIGTGSPCGSDPDDISTGDLPYPQTHPAKRIHSHTHPLPAKRRDGEETHASSPAPGNPPPLFDL